MLTINGRKIEGEPQDDFGIDRDPVHGGEIEPEPKQDPSDRDPNRLPENSHLGKHIGRSGKKIRGSGK